MTTYCVRFYAAATSTLDEIRADTPQAALYLARGHLRDGAGHTRFACGNRPGRIDEISVCDAEGFELAHWRWSGECDLLAPR